MGLTRSDDMIVKSQRELDYVLIYPTSLLPSRLRVDFDNPDFKGRSMYSPVPEGMQGEYVLSTA